MYNKIIKQYKDYTLNTNALLLKKDLFRKKGRI